VAPTDRLESWKEIAAYLNRDVRTVQRWEAAEELPVHRHQHKKRGSVYALRPELDAWRDSRRAELFEPAAELPAPAVTAPPPRRLAWAAALVVVTAGAIGLAAWLRASAPASPPADPPGDASRLFGEALREGGRIERIQLPGETGDLALSPDGATLYAAVCGSGASAVYAVDVASRAIAWTVDGVAGCTRIILDPRGERLLVADAPDILLVDTRTRAVARIVTPAATISDIALTPDGRTLYAAAAFGGLLAIDTIGRTVNTISRLPCPMQVALSPAGDRLYVNYQCGGPGGRRGHDSIEVLDTKTNRAIAVIKDLPNVGGDLAVSGDGAFLWADGLDACRNEIYDRAGCPEGPGFVHCGSGRPITTTSSSPRALMPAAW
jgi:DNA-binding beta-propeller fold protein YncE